MAKWIEGFKPGKHIDTAGIAHTFTEADCRELAGTYNPQLHEAPIVAGHPKHDDPAMGWVGSLRFNEQTQRVEYTEKDLLPVFTEMLAAKSFKKRSMALYTRADPRNPTPGKLHLRHVGYLGAMPPAIKGLQDRQAFKEADSGGVTFEFGDWNDRLIARMFRSIKNFLTGEYGQEKADQVLNEWDLESLTEEAVKPEPADSPLSGSYHEQEEDMNKEEVQALIKEAVTGATQQFSEMLKPLGDQLKTLTDQNTALAKQFAEGEDAAARREFTAFCEGLPTRIVPGEIPTLVDQMMNLRKAADVSFGEGDQKKTISAVEDLQTRLKARVETVQFGEFAGKDRAVGRQSGDADAVTLARKATEFQESEGKAGRTVTLAQALLHVETEMAGGAQ
jgi:ribosomal protein S15P/S13E